MIERGKIREHAFVNISCFTGLRYGTMTPTDIDAFLDFHNLAFVFVEAKHARPDLPYGQSLALERICDACQAGGIPSVVFVVVWQNLNADGEIEFSDAIVKAVYFEKKWRKNVEALTLKKYVDRFIHAYGGGAAWEE